MRLPIRIRLTTAFAVVLALVLLAVGVFVVRRFRDNANSTIDAELRTRAEAFASAGSTQGQLAVDLLGLSDERFGELIDRSGAVAVRSRQLTGTPIGTRIPGWHTTSVRTRTESRHVRLFVRELPGGTLVLATALDDRDEALAQLRASLWWSGAITFAIATMFAWLLAGRALRPVDQLRAAAARYSVHDLGGRLAEPAADDEIRRLAMTLNDMLGRIQRSVERERSFVDRASHELRTPLANLSLGLELALRHPEDRDALHVALAAASAEVSRLDALASNLLVLARTTDDGLLILRDDVDVNALLDSTLATFRARAALDGVDLVLDVPSGIIVRLDPMRVRQAITNLLDNALRVTPAGRAVTTTARMLGDTLEISVTDRGPGFAPDVVDHAFAQFTRGRAGASADGAGLGLAIVAAVAAAHGGTATIDPPNGNGAVVRISIAQASPDPAQPDPG